MTFEIDFTKPGRFVEANGLNIHYQEAGAGAPLLLLHGGTATATSWREFVPMLAPHFRVIMPDTRAHGRTANPSGAFSYRLLADDVAALVGALGLDKPLLMGFSDGGQALIEFGMYYPDLARALVIGGAAHYFSDAYYNALHEWGMEAPGVVDQDKIRASMDDVIDYLETEHAALGGRNYWLTLVQQISTAWLTPLDYSAADLQRIVAPTLVALGDRDVFPVEQAVELYRALPNAELAILPNQDHGVSARFMDTVLDFLLRHQA